MKLQKKLKDMDKWLIYLKTINMDTKGQIILLDYATADVVVLENIPSQEYIEEHHDGDWESWLYNIKHEKMPNMDYCSWMHTFRNKFEIETIKL